MPDGQGSRRDSDAECMPITFRCKPDVAGEYTLCRRPTSAIAASLNGIWDVGRGFQLSGLYFYGSGMRNGA